MKVLTIWQPWAWLIARGRKHVENRGINTDYRGPLIIHVGKHWEPEVVARQLEDLLEQGLISEAPTLKELEKQLGLIIAKTEITGCRKVEEADADPWAVPGGYAWELGAVELVEPIEFRGRQGLIDLPPGIEVRALGQAEAVIVAKAEPSSKFDPKVERDRLVVEVVPSDNGHGFVGQVHDNVSGEVLFVSPAFETESLAGDAARAYVDGRVQAVARAKMARLDALEHGVAKLDELNARLRTINAQRKQLGDQAKELRAEAAGVINDLRSGQSHLDFGVAEANHEDDEDDEEADEVELVVEFTDDPQGDSEEGPLGWESEPVLTVEDRAAQIGELTVAEGVKAIGCEMSIDVVREVQTLEMRKRGATKRKSVIAACERRIGQLLEAEEAEEAEGARDEAQAEGAPA
jgi:hypothetical protein